MEILLFFFAACLLERRRYHIYIRPLPITYLSTKTFPFFFLASFSRTLENLGTTLPYPTSLPPHSHFASVLLHLDFPTSISQPTASTKISNK